MCKVDRLAHFTAIVTVNHTYKLIFIVAFFKILMRLSMAEVEEESTRGEIIGRRMSKKEEE